MPPRRRISPTRRPRVAGLTNRTDVAETDARATTVTAAPAPSGRPADDARPATRRPRTRPSASPTPADPEVPIEDAETTDAPDDIAIDDAATDVDDAADPATADPDGDEVAEDGADGETVTLTKPTVADEHDADPDGDVDGSPDGDTVVVTEKPAAKKATTKKATTNKATTNKATANKAAASTAAGRPTGRSGRTSSARRPAAAAGPTLLDRLRTVPVLAGLLVVLVALAVFFGIATASLRGTPSAANTALTDVATTAEVGSQIGDALEKLYSYDFARLDENERDARDVITEGFTADFDRLFSQVRELAPQQQAVVSASVTVSAVREIADDRAMLVVFMDQQATTVASEEQVAAQGRLTVTAERGGDGRWRIAAVESR